VATAHYGSHGEGEQIRAGGVMRILIIDDERAVAHALADALRLEGHVPAVAHSLSESLAAIDAETPEAVFLDLVMPGLSGVDVLRRIREHHPALPVVVVTGQTEPIELDELRELGVTDIVEKPWALKQLGEALDRLQTEDV
jgi:DNA-binding response OmpR family regulator